MPGTLVKDKLMTDTPLFAATAIGSSTTTNGTARELPFRGLVTIQLVTGAITDGTYTVTIETAWDSGFTQGVSEVARFEVLDSADDSETKRVSAYLDGAYVRAVIVSAAVTTGGTIGPITVQEAHYQRVTGGPGMPTAPGTATSSHDTSND